MTSIAVPGSTRPCDVKTSSRAPGMPKRIFEGSLLIGGHPTGARGQSGSSQSINASQSSSCPLLQRARQSPGMFGSHSVGPCGTHGTVEVVVLVLVLVLVVSVVVLVLVLVLVLV